MSKRFVADVLEAIPELSYVDGYFYVSPVKHVLSGFVCNEKRHLTEVRRYVFPLYDRNGFLHLTYSRPALTPPDNIIHHGNKSDYIYEVINMIAPLLSKFNEALSLEGAISFIEDDHQNLGRIHPLRLVSVGYAYVLLGEKDRAIIALEGAADDDFVRLDKILHKDCLLILELAKNDGMAAAQRLLIEWEDVTKNWLAAKGCVFV